MYIYVTKVGVVGVAVVNIRRGSLGLFFAAVSRSDMPICMALGNATVIASASLLGTCVCGASVNWIVEGMVNLVEQNSA